jgi:hypothetical protein
MTATSRGVFMLGLFGPKCPLGTLEKTWVEWRMRWLADRFGIARMRRARVILPTNEFFPDKFAGDRHSAREYLDRMCRYMEINPATVSLEIIADDHMPGAAGLYEMRARSNICVAESQLAAPPQFLATLAHELSHELLIKGGHLNQDTFDHEQVTDLLPVFLGTGIFLANATVQSSSQSTGTVHSWSISRQGYLNSITLGYALAVFAYVRGEDRSPWAGYLRADAAVTLRAGLGYLRKTGDSLFSPDTADAPRARPTAAEVAEHLSHPSPTFRLAALWDVGEHDLFTTDLLPLVRGRLLDKDGDVRLGAIRTLGRFRAVAAGAVPQLTEVLWSGPPDHRAAAARALGEIGAAPTEVVPMLAATLCDGASKAACAAAEALARYGPAAAAAEPHLLKAMEAAVLTDYPRFVHLVAALRAVSPDPRSRIREHFAGPDGEIRRLALGVLKDQGGGRGIG